EMNLKEIK
ncbi:Hypothetical protein EIN_470270, partial [Entamoeba invadens IP1]